MACDILWISAISSILIVISLLLVWYACLFDKIVVETGEQPCDNLKVAYKFGRGPYKNVGAVFGEVTSIAPNQRSFGVYYDDPKKVPSTKLRWAVGSVLAEGSSLGKTDPAVREEFKKRNYKEFEFPKASTVVKTTFPFRSMLSIMVGVIRVYPAMEKYIQEMKLDAYPFIELSADSVTHHFAPVSEHEGFYVPETKQD